MRRSEAAFHAACGVVSLVDVVRQRARERPTKQAYVYLDRAGAEAARLSYAELDRRARAIASTLESLNAAGQRVLLLGPQSLEYLSAFFGCLYAGAVAVPTHCPAPGKSVERLRRVVADAEPTLALTAGPGADRFAKQFQAIPELTAIRHLRPDDVPDAAAETWKDPGLDARSLAFLQYTSGSTASPRGVRVTHGNLLHNEAMIQQAFAQGEDTVVVSWLPLYHDMGLIGGALQPLYAGASCVLMAPTTFLQRPIVWLQAISAYRATTSGGPNFAYELCLRKVGLDERRGLDLSGWTTAFNGSEPVAAETLERFAEVFGPCGFRRQAFYPCYGLAEATLLVAGGDVTEAPPVVAASADALAQGRLEVAQPGDAVRRLVSCGRALGEARLVVVDPGSRVECPPGRIGEIWISGPSVADGYWDRAEDTRRIFGGLLAGSSAGPFLRTGDAGCISDGELYVTGRLKEMMIFRGRNCYPHDVEETVRQCHAALAEKTAAAFSIEVDGEERLVVLQEFDRRDGDGAVDEVATVVRAAIAEQHEVSLHALAFLKAGSIPRTTSGKLQRGVCRARYLAGEWTPLASRVWAESSAEAGPDRREALLAASPDERAALLADALRLEAARLLAVAASAVDPEASLVSLGIDSLAAADLAQRIEAAFGVMLDATSVLEGWSIARLARQLAAQSPAPATAPVSLAPEDPAGIGELPLSPDQDRLWIAEGMRPGTSAFHVQAGYRMPGPLDSEALERALREVVGRHGALRSAFVVRHGGPVQLVAREVVPQLKSVGATAGETLDQALSRVAQEEVGVPFDLSRPGLLRGAIVRGGGDEWGLLFTVHHIVCDAWSLGTFVRELVALYDARCGRSKAELPAPAVGYGAAVRWQRAAVAGPEALAYWQAKLAGARVLELPPETASGAPSELAAPLSFVVAPRLAEAVRALARQQTTTPFTVLLATFQALLGRHCQRDDFIIATPVKGRSHPALDGVVGFFARPIPIRSQVDGAATFAELLARTRETTLEAFAHQDVPFQTLARMMAAETGRGLARLPVMFSVLPGRATEMPLTHGVVTPSVLRAGTSDCPLFLTLIEEGRGFRGSILFDPASLADTTAAQLAESYVALLERLATEPRARISDLRLVQPLEDRLAARQAQTWSLCLAASFTADPVEPPLAFWMERLALDARIERAPQYQVFQQLLDPASILARNRGGVNLILLRASDLLGPAPGAAVEEEAAALAAALRSASEGPAAHWLVCVCPEGAPSEATRRWEAALGSALAGASRVSLLSSGQILAGYPLAEYHDPQGESLAQLPYTEELFASLATAIARRVGALLGLFRPKVIVLDCDNTLWRGVCGEDGPRGVDPGGPHRALQALMVAQQEAGVLLCLASKNNPEDVEAVFRERDDMPLRPAHITRSCVHWGPKSGSIRALSEELRLGLDSFVFLDDDPVECAEVRRALPEVLTLELPRDPARISEFLSEVWAFDRVEATAEARLRTSLYRQEAERESLRRESRSLAGFLEELRLAVRSSWAAAADRPRVAELVARTNQFNTTGQRRSEGELARLLATGQLEARVTRVSDRFGDYGLVGVALVGGRERGLEVESWLLSCRALGRGVEHRMAADLAGIARDRGLGLVEVAFRPTSRNRPAAELLESLAATCGGVRGDGSWRFETARLLEARYAPETDALPAAATAEAEAPARRSSPLAAALPGELVDPRQLVRAVRARRRRSRPLPASTWVAPRTPLEAEISAIAGGLVEIDGLGVEDNLFTLGADSLLATQLVSRLRSALGADVTLPMLFEAPTVRALASRIEALAPGALPPPLAPAARRGPLPLSYAQQRLWLLDQLHPGNPFYNINTAVRLRGDLDVKALSGALAALVARHEALRTRFPVVEGQPVQEIAEALDVRLEQVDLSGDEPNAREAQAMRLIAAAARRPFDLARGPLLRALVVRLEDRHHLLLLSLHHLVSDGWSMVVLVREVRALYAALRRGEPATLAPLGLQYADYACWQREWLQGAALEAQLGYWRERLAGAPALLELPADRPRPAVASFRGSHHAFQIPAETVSRLRAVAREHGVTLFSVVLAAWEVLLHRYTGEEDVVVGVPVANRNRPEVEGLIGFFVNTLVVRTDLGGNPSFGELLARVGRAMLAAQAHQDVPFDKLVSELRPERDQGGNSFFRVLVELHERPEHDLDLPGLEAEVLPRIGDTSIFDLFLSLELRGERIEADLEYSTDLFDASRVERMAAHFATVLDGVLQGAQTRLAELEVLTTAERSRLRSWDSTEVSYPAVCIPALVEAQVRRTPEAPAVVCGTERWTYADLNARANRLARYLRRRGAGPESLVGVYLERGPELIAGLLGILKAGAAWVPLDPAYPVERLQLLLRNAGLEMVLTQGRLAGTLPPSAPPRVVVDAEREAIAAEGDDDLGPVATPDNLCHVIYTSGSTGVPKGVAIQHCSVAAFLDWALRCFSRTELGGVLASTSICFDLSVFEIFAPLACGGAVVLTRSAFELPSLPAAGLVTLVNTVPSIAVQLLADDALPPSVRVVNLAGEALPGSLVEELYRRDTIEKVFNLYGPTEDTTYSTFALIPRGAGGAPPIGRPIANTRAYVLLAGAMRAPSGIPGEICLAGDGLARGYVHSPGRTADRFRPDPLGTRPGGRMYRTGDLGRLREDGTLEYLGRLDQQIKLHGCRIEPGEIEDALLGHAAVRQAVVTLQPGPKAGRQLVAYVAPEAGERPRADELTALLRNRLPEYMVPRHMVVLDALPLTPNGKIDRARLPLPENNDPQTEGAASAVGGPRSDVERALVEIWSRVLGRDHVGIHDNFFHLGGDSILGLQIAAKATQAGIPLGPRHLFQYQTIAELAAAAEPATTEATAAEEADDVTAELPLTPIQRWFFEQDLSRPEHWNQAVLLEVRRGWPGEVLERALQHLAAHHEALRLRFHRCEGGWRQVAAEPGDPVPLDRVDLSGLGASDSEAAIERHAAALQAGLDLSRGPLLRGALFVTGTTEPPRLLLVAHHLIVDAVSWSVLLEDLATACEQLCARREVLLPPKTLSFRRWSQHLQDQAQRQGWLDQAAHWTAEARQDIAPLPVDFENGDDEEASTRRVVVSFTESETRELLLDFPATMRASLEETLLAGVASALRSWTGRDALLVDVEGHGREDIGVAGGHPSRTIGWFTSLFPWYVDLRSVEEPVEVLRTVKEQFRRVPARGIGYGILRHLVSGALWDRLQSLPAAEVSFNYLGQLDHLLGPDAPFDVLEGPTGPTRSPRARRTHRLEIVARIHRGRLEAQWSYGANRHAEATVSAVAAEFAATVRALLRARAAACHEAWVPADFPLAEVTSRELQRACAVVGGAATGVEDVYALSPAQQGMLFHSLYTPESGVYFMQLACRLDGSVDLERFRQAWREAVGGFAALRTSFAWEGLTHPLQVVHRAAAPEWTLVDWRGVGAAEERRRHAELLRADRRRGFDLAAAPLMRMTLAATDRGHRFVWSYHHLLLDGWSTGLVLARVVELYRCLKGGAAASERPPRPFRDYVGWLARQDRIAAEEFWRRRLAGLKAATRLRFDRGTDGSSREIEAFETHDARLAPELVRGVRALAGGNRLTLHTVLQGAWALLLGHYGNTEDVSFGTVVSGRPPDLPFVDQIAGLFVNTLPVRVRLPRRSPVLGWLHELQEAEAEMRQYEYSPLADVQGWSDVPRGQPLVESIFSLNSYPLAEALRGDADLRFDEIAVIDWNSYPLSVAVEARDGIELQVKYDPRRFDRGAIARAMGVYERLLGALASRPETTLEQAAAVLAEAEGGRRAADEAVYHSAVESRLGRLRAPGSAGRGAGEGDGEQSVD
jgi:amino acid adenylation domain-containing protein/FkbH-like protein/non-ribosomal peptide synthase protein (TIGR01720 family)